MTSKNLIILLSLLCATLSMASAGIARHWDSVLGLFPALTSWQIDLPGLVVASLNYAVPVSIGCLLVLFRVRRAAEISGLTMTMMILLNMLCADQAFRAKDAVFGRDKPLSTLTWWMPAQEKGIEKMVNQSRMVARPLE